MMITKTMTDLAISKELFNRLEVHRQRRGMSQEALVDNLGISRPTYARLEKGTCSFGTFISVLRQLNLLEGLDALVPEPTIRPIDIFVENSKHSRVSGSLKSKKKLRVVLKPCSQTVKNLRLNNDSGIRYSLRLNQSPADKENLNLLGKGTFLLEQFHTMLYKYVGNVDDDKT